MLDSTGITQIAARKRVGIFFPFADLWTHQRAIHLLARRWSTESDITIVSCDAQRKSPCPAQRSLKLNEASSPESRALVCKRCRASTELNPSIRYCSIGEYPVIPYELPRNLAGLLNFEIDHQPLGKVALYDLLLTMKCAPQDIPESSIAAISAAICDTTDIYFRMKKLLEKEQFDCLIVNNELYAMNSAASLAARSLGIDTFNLHLGDFRSQSDRSITIRPCGENYSQISPGLDPTANRESVVDQRFERLLRREYKNRFYGRNSLTYSPRSPRFRYRQERKAVTDQYRASLILSSPDEQYTYRFVKGLSQGDLSQVDIINTFFAFAKSNPNEHFLVRLHPRLFSNRRDRNEASSAAMIRKALDAAPPNVDLDGPPDFRPILSVLRQSQVVVVSWSSLALDAAALGIPVVLGKKLGSPFAAVAVEVDGPSLHHLNEAIFRAENRSPEEHQGRALDFWLYRWRQHRFASTLRIHFSPALLALWVSTRFSLLGLEGLHAWLRKMELRYSPGFAQDSLELLPERFVLGNGLDQGRMATKENVGRRVSRPDVYRGLRGFL